MIFLLRNNPIFLHFKLTRTYFIKISPVFIAFILPIPYSYLCSRGRPYFSKGRIDKPDLIIETDIKVLIKNKGGVSKSMMV
ncbi:MAG: hypothetical protein KTR26_10375 [Flammeovirgaceae bacterium]|nr:hypothetical protein [Flammeovirgaceae bacterium]